MEYNLTRMQVLTTAPLASPHRSALLEMERIVLTLESELALTSSLIDQVMTSEDL